VLTAERVREALDYDPETGVFRSKSTYRRSQTGKVVGASRTGGWISLNIDKKAHRAHRVAWLYVYGYMPPYIDHKDGNPANNRLSNLRVATKQENARNRRATSKCGLKGVSLDSRKTKAKWRARIKVDDKQIGLGYFETKEAAAAAYAVAAHQFFGEFART
jgi:hypothetical protein